MNFPTIENEINISYNRQVAIISFTRELPYFVLICAVGLWALRPLTGLLYQPRMIGDGDCGETGGVKIGRGNRSTMRQPAPAPLCPPQIPHD
jgi:hypothetical protein